MRLILCALLSVTSVTLQAADLVTPHTFSAGTPALATQVNENFQTHADAINALAVLTPITALPFTITAPGSYYLKGNLASTAAGITINADNVTLDLMGFTMQGNGSSNYGIALPARSNIVIRNGTVTGFGLAGIYEGLFGNANTVEQVQVIANGLLGNSSTHSGIVLVGNNNRIIACNALGNGGDGIQVGVSSLVRDSKAANNGGAHGIRAGSASTLANNQLYYNTGVYGIYAGAGATLTENTIRMHQGDYGIYAASGAILTRNTVSYTVGLYGIVGDFGAAFDHNVATFNQHWGIWAKGSNSLTGNVVTYNNESQSVTGGGIWVTDRSQLINNQASYNYQYGIHVTGAANLLRNNNVGAVGAVGAVSTCMQFDLAANGAIGNTASACITPYGGTGYPPTTVFRDNDTF